MPEIGRLAVFGLTLVLGSFNWLVCIDFSLLNLSCQGEKPTKKQGRKEKPVQGRCNFIGLFTSRTCYNPAHENTVYSTAESQ